MSRNTLSKLKTSVRWFGRLTTGKPCPERSRRVTLSQFVESRGDDHLAIPKFFLFDSNSSGSYLLHRFKEPIGHPAGNLCPKIYSVARGCPEVDSTKDARFGVFYRGL